MVADMSRRDVLQVFHPAVTEWFTKTFPAPTTPQLLGWPAIARGESTLMLAPTGSGKTLAAFLWCLNRLMFSPAPPSPSRCRVLYISPLKALAVDVERNLRAPLEGIASVARAHNLVVAVPAIAIRTGDTPALDRARFGREASDILITTPESLFLLLTSNARERLTALDTVIIDEIHALVAGKRGAHLALSLERLEALRDTDRRPLQRIGLSATQRPLEEVARFLGGAASRTSRSRRVQKSERAPTTVAAELRDELTGTSETVTYRPVTIVNAAEKKQLSLRIEVPVEDMARLATKTGVPETTTTGEPVRPSIWTSVHPRLLELIRAHSS
jgi:ATP-dependent Lhr-like helicase